MEMINAGLPAASTKEAYSRLDEIIKKRGSNFGRHFNQLCKSYGVKDDPMIVAAGIAAYHNMKVGLMHLFPGVGSMLVRLVKDGYLLGLVTNGVALKQWDKIHRLKLRDFFDTIIVSGKRYTKSSKVKLLKKALKELGVKPKEAIYVGDVLETDMESANRLGMVSVQVTKRSSSVENEPKGKYQTPDYKIDETPHLIGIIDKIKGK